MSRLAADGAAHPFPKDVTNSGPGTRTTSWAPTPLGSRVLLSPMVCHLFSTALQSVVSDTRVLAA